MQARIKLVMQACARARQAAQERAATSDYWATVATVLGDESFHRVLATEAAAWGDPREAVRTVIARYSCRARGRFTGAANEFWFELKGVESLLVTAIDEAEGRQQQG